MLVTPLHSPLKSKFSFRNDDMALKLTQINTCSKPTIKTVKQDIGHRSKIFVDLWKYDPPNSSSKIDNLKRKPLKYYWRKTVHCLSKIKPETGRIKMLKGLTQISA